MEERAPKFMGWEKSKPLILTSGGCQGDPPTNQSLEAEGRIKSMLLDDTHKASSLPTEDPHST